MDRRAWWATVHGSQELDLMTKSPPDSACALSRFRSNSLRPRGLQPARLLCPWDFPGKNTRMGCHALLQGIFLTQGSNLLSSHLT